MNKTTISVGIPAYNEEANIKYLLEALLAQDLGDSLELKEVIVVSDGSTDRTVELAKTVGDSRIVVVDSRERQGKFYVENQLVSRVDSDILVILDADTLPADASLIKNITAPIIVDDYVGLVAGNAIPVKPTNFIEKILANSHEIKKGIGMKINRGDNIYMCTGLARAFRKEFYKKMKWEQGFPEDAISYARCRESGFRFVYEERARVYFRLPANLADHLSQSRRFHEGMGAVTRSVELDYYKIPLHTVVSLVLRSILSKPLLTMAYLFIILYVRFLIPKNSGFGDRWSTPQSTKERISMGKVTTGSLEKYSVTVGIPAYNEEANIKNLLQRILAQEHLNFNLKEIIVSSDGSSDATVREARSLNNDSIKVIDNKDRKGQAVRQNEILNISSGDILVLLNADVAPVGNDFIDSLVETMVINNADLVGVATMPAKPANLFESVVAFSHDFKVAIYKTINGGNNLYLCHGRARVFSRRLYTRFRWEFGYPEDSFSYLYAVSNGYKFIYTDNARVIFRSPDSFKDYIKQSARFLHGQKKLGKHFGDRLVQSETRINPLSILAKVTEYLFRSPVKLTFYAALFGLSLVIKNFYRFDARRQGIWDVSESSKKNIN